MATDLTAPIFTVIGGIVTGGLALLGLRLQRQWTRKDRLADREDSAAILKRQQDHTRELLLKQLGDERQTRLRAERREAYAVFLDRAEACLSACIAWAREPPSHPYYGGSPPPQPTRVAADLGLAGARTACNVMMLVGADAELKQLAEQFIERCRTLNQGEQGPDRNIREAATALETLSTRLRDDLRAVGETDG